MNHQEQIKYIYVEKTGKIKEKIPLLLCFFPVACAVNSSTFSLQRSHLKSKRKITICSLMHMLAIMCCTI